ncbi:salicylate hydroxylase [Purpureocillium lavendulum]|uniref:Salicylate hydroxylase n=1 Tax=Purpureocillium lavendulum TaxID=1247861 RepID=A0AB34FIZ0_9HYPO|nr:salicylate hydroxylase [Purpureocillium lavendulum]
MARHPIFQLLAWAAALVVATEANTSPKRYDDGDVHRMEKRAPQVTRRAVLMDKRDDGGACGLSMKSCPSSLDGGCCPENYDCAIGSCVATTKGPSTCGTLVGWYACQAVYGGGCCPDGYQCQRGANCVPPTGSAYTYNCPTGHFLCPASASYGCCPNGMGCAVNQCYSTAPTTMVNTMVITTSASGGKKSVYTTTQTTVGTPDVPTALPTVVAGDGNDEQKVLKYFPSVVAKTSPTGDASGAGGGGISGAQLGGIVAGVVAFVIILIVAGFLLFRRLRRKKKGGNKHDESGGAGSGGRHLAGEKGKPFQTADSDNDTMSVDPLMMLPSTASASPPYMHRPSPGLDSRVSGNSPDPFGATSDQTPTSYAGGIQSVGRGGGTGRPEDSRHPSWDSNSNNNNTITSGYFDAQYAQRNQRHQRLVSSEAGGVARTVSRMTHDSRPTFFGHGRDVSDTSDASSSVAYAETEGRPSIGGTTPALLAELEAQPYIAELPPNSPASVSIISSSAGVPSPVDPSLHHNGEHFRYRQRSGSGGSGTSATSAVSAATSTTTSTLPGPGGRPPLVHQRKRSEGRAGAERLGVVDEEMIHGYHGPREFLAGQTGAENPLTEVEEKETR